MKLILIFSFCCVFQQQILSQSKSLLRSTTGVSGSSRIVVNEGNTYVIQQSIGQPSVIGTIEDGNYIFRQGFIQPDVLAKIVDKNVPLNLQVKIYPNPFDKHISLFFVEEVKSDINIKVFDVLGRQIFKTVFQKRQQTDVILDKLPLGEYLIKIIANKKQFVAKIMKK